MNEILTMSPQALAAVQAVEDHLTTLPQVQLRHTHTLFAGLYARTLHIPAGVCVTGVLIKIPTVLIISGSGVLHVGDGTIEIEDYAILEGAPGRKQAFQALTDCNLTMSFATDATTVDEAEQEFTDEIERLQNRRTEACVE